MKVKNLIVRSKRNPNLVLCTNGEFMPETMMGPGGYSAQTYKTHAGASRVRSGEVIVEAIEVAS